MTPQQITHVKNYIHHYKVSFLGKCLSLFLPYRKEIVLANFDIVFKEMLSNAEKQKLLLCFYTHIGKLITEFIKFRCLFKKKLITLVRIEGIEHALPFFLNNKPIILLAGHIGNWEIAPIAMMTAFPVIKDRAFIIRRKIKPEFIFNFLFSHFRKAGIHVVPKNNSLHTILEHLATKNLLFVLDQYSLPGSHNTVLVDFFGTKTGTYRSLALLKLATESPVIPIYAARNSDNTHTITIGKPLPWIEKENLNDEILANTRQFNQVLEDIILEHPEQWIWCHRRWRE